MFTEKFNKALHDMYSVYRDHMVNKNHGVNENDIQRAFLQGTMDRMIDQGISFQKHIQKQIEQTIDIDQLRVIIGALEGEMSGIIYIHPAKKSE